MDEKREEPKLHLVKPKPEEMGGEQPVNLESVKDGIEKENISPEQKAVELGREADEELDDLLEIDPSGFTVEERNGLRIITNKALKLRSQLEFEFMETLERTGQREEGAIDFKFIRARLEEQGFKVKGFEVVSGAIWGRYYGIKTDKGMILEKSFTHGIGVPRKKEGEVVKAGKRWIAEDPSQQLEFQQDEIPEKMHSRFQVLDAQLGKVEYNIIDIAHNEEQALKDLQGIPGIPKFYGSVLGEQDGSILVEFVDGYDFMMEGFDGFPHFESEQQLNHIIDQIAKTFNEAAERGYIFNNIDGATIMVNERTQQPFISDCHDYYKGNIHRSPEAKDYYEQGLKKLEKLRQERLEQYRQSKK